MALRDQASPLTRTTGEVESTRRPEVVSDYPVRDPRLSFQPAYRTAGWRVALRLQDQQRCLQANKGVG